MDFRDRQRGAFLGLAIGDALGAAVEFKPAGSFLEVIGYRGGGPHALEPGEWTDDTSMALALADSIGDVGWDLDDQAKRYVAWWRSGAYSVNGRVFDVGITTQISLQRYCKTGDAFNSGDPSSRASGNGSIMRLAPVPVGYVRLFPDHINLLVERLVESSRPTHGSAQCLSACAYMGTLICGLLHGLSREEVLDPAWPPLREVERLYPMNAEIGEIARGSFRTKRPPEIKGSGYVVKSLEAALWAFYNAASFDEAVLRAVNLGDDADTTGAVCGQFAGAFFGEAQISQDLRTGLAGRDQIEPILNRLIG